MSQILYIHILVDWSLSGKMTSKLVIHESESPRPAASLILISRMTRSSVIIPYRIHNFSSFLYHRICYTYVHYLKIVCFTVDIPGLQHGLYEVLLGAVRRHTDATRHQVLEQHVTPELPSLQQIQGRLAEI